MIPPFFSFPATFSITRSDNFFVLFCSVPSPLSCFLLAGGVRTCFVALPEGTAIHLAATADMFLQASPQSVNLCSQSLSNLSKHCVLRLQLCHLLVKLSYPLHFSHPALGGCDPVPLPLPFQLITVNVIVSGKSRGAVIKGVVACHVIIFGLVFQTPHGERRWWIKVGRLVVCLLKSQLLGRSAIRSMVEFSSRTCAHPFWQKLFCSRVERGVLLVGVAILLLLWVSHVAHVWAAQASQSRPGQSQISKVNTSHNFLRLGNTRLRR